MGSHDKICKLLSKRVIKFNESLPSYLICNICGHVAINAYSGPCECIYCKKCLEKYLATGEKNCPGVNNSCKAVQLILGKNVTRNDRINKEVWKSMVKCPSTSCDHVCELVKMVNHIKSCDKKEIQCPFQDVGCDTMMPRKKMYDHLENDVSSHNKMLTKFTTNNEIRMNNKIEMEVNKRNKEMEENMDELSNCLTLELKKQRTDINILVSSLHDIKIQNEQLKITVNNLEQSLERQGKACKSKIGYNENESGESGKRILLKEKISQNNDTKGQIGKVKQDNSSTIKSSQSFKSNYSDNENRVVRRRKTSTINSSESLTFTKRGEKRICELINLFN